MTAEVKLFFEIDGIAEDANGNPGATGLSITMEVEDLKEIPTYEQLVADVNIPGVLKVCNLEGVVKPEAVRIITPEEYAERYGEE